MSQVIFGIAILILLLCSCSIENKIDEVNQELKTKLYKEEISIEELQNTDVFKYFDEKIDISGLLKKEHQFDKTQLEENPILTINTSTINLVRNGRQETYTMFVEYREKEPGIYYNLVLYKNQFTYLLYTLKISRLQKTNSRKLWSNSPKTLIKAVKGLPHEPDGWDPTDDSDSTGGTVGQTECWDITVTIEYACTGAGHWVGEDCLCGTHPDFSCNRAYLESQTTQVCEWIPTDENNNSGIGNGTNGNENNGGNPVIITPDEICPDGQIENADGDCINPPCEDIKTQINNENFKAKKEELSNLTHKKYESGYVQSKTGTFVQLPVVNNGHSLSLNGVDFAEINGFIHTHVDDFLTGEIDISSGLPEENKIFRIFSPADVIAFLKIAKEASDTSKVFATVLTSTGNYTLRFTGAKDEITGIKKAIEYEEDYKKLMNKGVERGFLHFLKDEIKVDGIELYKLKKPLFSSSVKIQHKTLNNAGNVVKIDCE